MSAVATSGVEDAQGAEVARVRAVEDLGVLHLGREERFDRITRLARELFGVGNASVTLLDRDRQYVKSTEGKPLLEGPRVEAFCDHTIREDDALVVEDATADARFAANPLVTGADHVRFYAGHPLTVSGGHRVGALCLIDDRPRTFGERERALLAELAGWVQNELTRSEELEHAASVQRRLLPRRSPVLPGYEVAGLCLPSRGVGGDFLDWYVGEDGDLVVTIADVMGKGMAAAIIMATVRGAVRSSGRTAEPGDAVHAAAATLAEDLEETSTLVTLCQARLTPHTGELRWADAGHALMLLVSADGSVRRAPRGGLPLGVDAAEHWEQRSVVLEPGDAVVAFSDGVLDLFDDVPEAFEEVARVAAAGSAERTVAHFRRRALSVPVLDDDITLGVIRRVG